MIQQTLPRVAHEHHERLLVHVDRMPELGDRILTAPADELRAGATEMSDFLTATLIPHVDAAERTLYPELERLLQNRHSMAPMRREHGDVRRLVAAFAELTRQLETSTTPTGRRLALRRVLFQVYALVKIHLAEEDAYLRIVEHGVTSEVGDVLAAALDHPGFRDA
jgi:iron-sulfur cluster repair protein YtfE (RIC family)